MFLSKPVQLDGEFREILQLRQENIYIVTGEDTGATNENQTTGTTIGGSEPAHSVGWFQSEN